VKIHNCQQGTIEWMRCRAGIPTASRLDVLMTAKARKGELTQGSRTYMHEKLAEWVTGEPIVENLGGFVERGKELEAEAIANYAFDRDVTVVPVGFITLDDGSAGCSPDGLVGTDGIVEAKCYSLQNHIAALLEADDEHYAQVQGGLWITERTWVDRIYWNPILPPVVVRIERDEDYIADLAASVEAFNGHLAAAKAKLLALGCRPKAVKGRPETGLGSTQGTPDGSDHPKNAPGASRACLATELAAAIRMMPDNEDRALLFADYMLHPDPLLEQSIAGLTDGILTELNADVGLLEKGI